MPKITREMMERFFEDASKQPPRYDKIFLSPEMYDYLKELFETEGQVMSDIYVRQEP